MSEYDQRPEYKFVCKRCWNSHITDDPARNKAGHIKPIKCKFCGVGKMRLAKVIAVRVPIKEVTDE